MNIPPKFLPLKERAVQCESAGSGDMRDPWQVRDFTTTAGCQIHQLTNEVIKLNNNLKRVARKVDVIL